MRSAAALLRAPHGMPPVQQRLYTGALFAADVNRNLHRFAQQHGLTSTVWVPVRAFDAAVKPFGVFVLPSAALCDVSISQRGHAIDQTGTGSAASRVLVNAEHTSNPHLFEGFHKLLVPLITSDKTVTEQEALQQLDSTGGAVANSNTAARDSAREASHHGFPIVHHPCVTEFGEPIIHSDTLNALHRYKKEKGFHSNYWLIHRDTGDGGSGGVLGYRNAEETDVPGRYNPTYACRYHPMTLVGAPLRDEVKQLMRIRAVRYGYVSPVWVTRAEAEGRIGTRLRPERAGDVPLVLHGGDSCDPVVLYCADQFEDSERLFPLPKEIELARKGVWLPPEKLRAFPLLHRVSCEVPVRRDGQGLPDASKEAASQGKVGGSVRLHSLQDARAGADVAMLEARRHLRLLEERKKMGHVRLFGFRQRYDERKHLANTKLETSLQEFTLLRGFPSAHFFSHRHVHLYGLLPRPGEVGLSTYPSPCRLWGDAWLDGECWYNIAQLSDPATALSLFYNHPIHFLTRRRLSRELATTCCRVQRCRQYTTGEWVPRFLVADAGWRLREGAPCVPFCSKSLDWDYKRRASEGGVTDLLPPHLANTLVHMDEVRLPEEAKAFLRSYRPVDDQGRPYLRTMRMLTALRALEQGYTSAVWVPVYPASVYVCKDAYTPPPTASQGAGGGTALRGMPFGTPPLVQFRGTFFANAEAVANLNPERVRPPVPWSEMTPYARVREMNGEGSSAEKANVPELRAMRYEEEEDSYTAAEVEEAEGTTSFTASEMFDAKYDVPVDDYV